MRIGRSRRILAAMLVISFSFSEISLAATMPHALVPESGGPRSVSIPSHASVAELVADPSRLAVPAHARIRETHRGTGDRLILLLEDAHSNLSAQESIADTIGTLMDAHGLNLVLSEGSSRDASLAALRQKFPHAELERSAKRLLLEGLIAGHEYLTLASDRPMSLIGVEDAALYRENLEAYAALARNRERMLAWLRRTRISIGRAKDRLYPQAALDYEKVSGKYDDFAQSFEKLRAAAVAQGIELGGYPQIQRLAEIRRREEEIDWVTLRAGADGEAKAVYDRYQKDAASIEFYELLDEMAELEGKVYAAWLGAGDAGVLRAIDRFTALLEKAYRIQMSSDEYASWERNADTFLPASWQGFLNRILAELGLYEDIVPEEPELESSRSAIENFYSAVGRRDEAFVRNAERELGARDAKAAFLVVGGYHAANLTRLLREKGYSYAVLTPEVAYETDFAKYEKMLLAPLERARESTLSQLLAIEADARSRFVEYVKAHPLRRNDSEVIGGILMLPLASGSRLPTPQEKGDSSSAPLTYKLYSEMTPEMRNAAALASLIQRAFKEFGTDIVQRQEMQNFMAQKWSGSKSNRYEWTDAMIAYQDDEPVGVYTFSGSKDYVANANMIYVSEEARRAGMGTELQARVFAYLKGLNHTIVRAKHIRRGDGGEGVQKLHRRFIKTHRTAVRNLVETDGDILSYEIDLNVFVPDRARVIPGARVEGSFDLDGVSYIIQSPPDDRDRTERALRAISRADKRLLQAYLKTNSYRGIYLGDGIDGDMLGAMMRDRFTIKICELNRTGDDLLEINLSKGGLIRLGAGVSLMSEALSNTERHARWMRDYYKIKRISTEPLDRFVQWHDSIRSWLRARIENAAAAYADAKVRLEEYTRQAEEYLGQFYNEKALVSFSLPDGVTIHEMSFDLLSADERRELDGAGIQVPEKNISTRYYYIEINGRPYRFGRDRYLKFVFPNMEVAYLYDNHNLFYAFAGEFLKEYPGKVVPIVDHYDDHSDTADSWVELSESTLRSRFPWLANHYKRAQLETIGSFMQPARRDFFPTQDGWRISWVWDRELDRIARERASVPVFDRVIPFSKYARRTRGGIGNVDLDIVQHGLDGYRRGHKETMEDYFRAKDRLITLLPDYQLLTFFIDEDYYINPISAIEIFADLFPIIAEKKLGGSRAVAPTLLELAEKIRETEPSQAMLMPIESEMEADGEPFYLRGYLIQALIALSKDLSAHEDIPKDVLRDAHERVLVLADILSTILSRSINQAGKGRQVGWGRPDGKELWDAIVKSESKSQFRPEHYDAIQSLSTRLNEILRNLAQAVHEYDFDHGKPFDPGQAVLPFNSTIKPGFPWVHEGITLTNTSFVVGAVNDENAIRSLRHWPKYASTQKRLKPDQDSMSGFMGADEDFVDVLLEARREMRVLGTDNLEIAGWLDGVIPKYNKRQPGIYSRRLGGFVKKVNGQKIVVSPLYDTLGLQDPPLPGPISRSQGAYRIRNAKTGIAADVILTEMHADLMRMYGFPEGKTGLLLDAEEMERFRDFDVELAENQRLVYGQYPTHQIDLAQIVAIFTGKDLETLRSRVPSAQTKRFFDQSGLGPIIPVVVNDRVTTFDLSEPVTDQSSLEEFPAAVNIGEVVFYDSPDLGTVVDVSEGNVAFLELAEGERGLVRSFGHISCFCLAIRAMKGKSVILGHAHLRGHYILDALKSETRIYDQWKLILRYLHSQRRDSGWSDIQISMAEERHPDRGFVGFPKGTTFGKLEAEAASLGFGILPSLERPYGDGIKNLDSVNTPESNVTRVNDHDGRSNVVEYQTRSWVSSSGARVVPNVLYNPEAVTIAMYNPFRHEDEAQSAMRVLDQVLAADLGVDMAKEIVFVIDNDPDHSVAKKYREILEARASEINAQSGGKILMKVINHDKNRGKGAAIRTAIGEATGEIFVTQDTDEEYKPSDLAALLKPFFDRQKNADVVYGKRQNKAKDSPHKLLFYGSHAITRWRNFLYQSTVGDDSTGYKLYRTRIIKAMTLVGNRFDLEPELTSKVLKWGYRIHNVPISRYIPRTWEQGKHIRRIDGVIWWWKITQYRSVLERSYFKSIWNIWRDARTVQVMRPEVMKKMIREVLSRPYWKRHPNSFLSRAEQSDFISGALKAVVKRSDGAQLVTFLTELLDEIQSSPRKYHRDAAGSIRDVLQSVAGTRIRRKGPETELLNVPSQAIKNTHYSLTNLRRRLADMKEDIETDIAIHGGVQRETLQIIRQNAKHMLQWSLKHKELDRIRLIFSEAVRLEQSLPPESPPEAPVIPVQKKFEFDPPGGARGNKVEVFGKSFIVNEGGAAGSLDPESTFEAVASVCMIAVLRGASGAAGMLHFIPSGPLEVFHSLPPAEAKRKYIESVLVQAPQSQWNWQKAMIYSSKSDEVMSAIYKSIGADESYRLNSEDITNSLLDSGVGRVSGRVYGTDVGESISVFYRGSGVAIVHHRSAAFDFGGGPKDIFDLRSDEFEISTKSRRSGPGQSGGARVETGDPEVRPMENLLPGGARFLPFKRIGGARLVESELLLGVAAHAAEVPGKPFTIEDSNLDGVVRVRGSRAGLEVERGPGLFEAIPFPAARVAVAKRKAMLGGTKRGGRIQTGGARVGEALAQRLQVLGRQDKIHELVFAFAPGVLGGDDAARPALIDGFERQINKLSRGRVDAHVRLVAGVDGWDTLRAEFPNAKIIYFDDVNRFGSLEPAQMTKLMQSGVIAAAAPGALSLGKTLAAGVEFYTSEVENAGAASKIVEQSPVLNNFFKYGTAGSVLLENYSFTGEMGPKGLLVIQSPVRLLKPFDLDQETKNILEALNDA